MLVPSFEGFTENTLVLMVVLTTVFCKPSVELRDTVLLVSGIEGETMLLSAIIIVDWSGV